MPQATLAQRADGTVPTPATERTRKCNGNARPAVTNRRSQSLAGALLDFPGP